MKKIIVFLSVSILLYGCSNNDFQTNNSLENSYQGDFLEIGVVGRTYLPDVDKVQYEYVELSEVSNNEKKFDALIVTSSAFDEADEVKYTSFFEKIDYPVFFFGIKNFRMFAFTNKNMTIEKSYDDNAPYVQGFKTENGEKIDVSIYNNGLSDEEVLIHIFNIIE